MEDQPAVEQIGFHPLGRQRRLTYRHIADQGRMRQRPGRTRHCHRQLAVEGQAQSITDDRLMNRGGTGRQSHRRRSVEHLADLQVVEDMGRSRQPCWH